jgi:hypothetical protein
LRATINGSTAMDPSWFDLDDAHFPILECLLVGYSIVDEIDGVRLRLYPEDAIALQLLDPHIIRL